MCKIKRFSNTFTLLRSLTVTARVIPVSVKVFENRLLLHIPVYSTAFSYVAQPAPGMDPSPD